MHWVAEFSAALAPCNRHTQQEWGERGKKGGGAEGGEKKRGRKKVYGSQGKVRRICRR